MIVGNKLSFFHITDELTRNFKILHFSPSSITEMKQRRLHIHDMKKHGCRKWPHNSNQLH